METFRTHDISVRVAISEVSLHLRMLLISKLLLISLLEEIWKLTSAFGGVENRVLRSRSAIAVLHSSYSGQKSDPVTLTSSQIV